MRKVHSPGVDTAVNSANGNFRFALETAGGIHTAETSRDHGKEIIDGLDKHTLWVLSSTLYSVTGIVMI